MKSLLSLLFPLTLIGAALTTVKEPATPEVISVSPQLRTDFRLTHFYKKTLIIESFPILASEKVPDTSLQEAAYLFRSMLKNRPDILWELGKNRIHFAVMAVDERTCDIPEHADLKPPAYWNRRARGLGATPQRPVVSCGSENLLANPGDPYATESIAIHEFAHAIHDTALSTLDPTFDRRLKNTFDSAMKRGLWAEKYAATNHREYWAEAVQSWFGTNRENDHDHNHVNTRAELIAYDPAIAKLCQEVFGKNDWTYLKPSNPLRKNDPHLKDLDRAKLKPFAWSKEEQMAYDALPARK
ncbi:MAG: hypothetical protein ACON5H_03480 [Akkermansiaceae bacterium]